MSRLSRLVAPMLVLFVVSACGSDPDTDADAPSPSPTASSNPSSTDTPSDAPTDPATSSATQAAEAPLWIAPKSCPDLKDFAFIAHDASDSPAVVPLVLDCRYTGVDGAELTLGVFKKHAAALRRSVERDAKAGSGLVVEDAPDLGPDAYSYDAYNTTCAVVVDTRAGGLEVNLSAPDQTRQCAETVALVLSTVVERA